MLGFAKSYQSNGCGHLWTSLYSNHFFVFQPNKEFGLFVCFGHKGKKDTVFIAACRICLVAGSGGHSLSAVHGLLIVVASLIAEPRLQGTEAQ